MTEQPARNSFRAAVVRGERKPLVVQGKAPKLGQETDSLEPSLVPRSEARSCDHRDSDRHRLTGETAIVHLGDRQHPVEVINLSGGGAMIRGDLGLRLWDIVELELGEGERLEAAVRWLRDGAIGLEFAHETRIDCGADERAQLLLDVIQRNFPGSPVRLEMPGDDDANALGDQSADLGNRRETRHPLVWKGELLFEFESNPVRIRNLSKGGALVDVVADYPPGSQVMLVIGNAGQISGRVAWTAGDQAGLRFDEPFEMARLAKAKPELTPHRWSTPDFLRGEGDGDSPWADGWGRTSIEALRNELEGFLKR